MSTMEQMVEAGARAFANISEGTDAFWQSYSEEMRSALLVALPILGEDLATTVKGDLDVGHRPTSPDEDGYCEAVFDMRARIQGRLSEIMEGK